MRPPQVGGMGGDPALPCSGGQDISPLAARAARRLALGRGRVCSHTKTCPFNLGHGRYTPGCAMLRAKSCCGRGFPHIADSGRWSFRPFICRGKSRLPTTDTGNAVRPPPCAARASLMEGNQQLGAAADQPGPGPHRLGRLRTFFQKVEWEDRLVAAHARRRSVAGGRIVRDPRRKTCAIPGRSFPPARPAPPPASPRSTAGRNFVRGLEWKSFAALDRRSGRQTSATCTSCSTGGRC